MEASSNDDHGTDDVGDGGAAGASVGDDAAGVRRGADGVDRAPGRRGPAVVWRPVAGWASIAAWVSSASFGGPTVLVDRSIALNEAAERRGVWGALKVTFVSERAGLGVCSDAATTSASALLSSARRMGNRTILAVGRATSPDPPFGPSTGPETGPSPPNPGSGWSMRSAMALSRSWGK